MLTAAGGRAEPEAADSEEEEDAQPVVTRKRKAAAQPAKRAVKDALTPGVPLNIGSIEDVVQLVEAGASGKVCTWVDMSNSVIQMAKLVFKTECERMQGEREELKLEVQQLRQQRDALSSEVARLRAEAALAAVGLAQAGVGATGLGLAQNV